MLKVSSMNMLFIRTIIGKGQIKIHGENHLAYEGFRKMSQCILFQFSKHWHSFAFLANWFVNKTKLCSGPASPVHVGVWTVDMQSSNIQEWNQITSKLHNVIYSRWLNSFKVKHSKIYYKMCINIECTCSMCDQS